MIYGICFEYILEEWEDNSVLGVAVTYFFGL